LSEGQKSENMAVLGRLQGKFFVHRLNGEILLLRLQENIALSTVTNKHLHCS
jgi:hypothetical protein